MEMYYVEGQEFRNQDFTLEPFRAGEYENCRFLNCNFSGVSLNNSDFINAGFKSCNLSNALIQNTSFQDVRFSDCKMLGLRFDLCNTFGFASEFNACMLSHSSFYKMKLRSSRFINSVLQQVDYTEAQLKNSVLAGCDLTNAVFERTNLEKANFLQASGYTIDPENNTIKGAIFSMPEVLGLLHKYQIKIDD